MIAHVQNIIAENIDLGGEVLTPGVPVTIDTIKNLSFAEKGKLLFHYEKAEVRLLDEGLNEYENKVNQEELVRVVNPDYDPEVEGSEMYLYETVLKIYNRAVYELNQLLYNG